MPANPHNDNAFYPAYGAAAGSAWGPVGTALGYTAGSVLGQAFGGGSSEGTVNLNLRRERVQRDALAQNALNNQKKWNRQIVKSQVQGAKAAGLHPLFAMGANMGSSPQFEIQGQSKEGSFAKKAISGIGQGLTGLAELNARKDLATHEATLSALTRATQLALQSRRPTERWDFPQGEPKRRPQVETKAGKDEDKTRDYVDMEGNTKEGVIPKGTQQEALEKEFGDLATFFPENFERAVKFLQDTGQIVTRKNLENILNFLNHMRKPIKKTTGPWKPTWKHPGARRTRRAGPQPYRPKYWR